MAQKIDKIMDKDFYEIIQEAFDNIDEAVCICNSEGEVIFWNKGSERLYGVEDKAITGKHIKDVFPNALCLRVLEEKKPLRNMTHEPVKGKSVLMSAIPIFNDNNEVVAIITTDRDITEVVNLLEELNLEKEKSTYYENEYKRQLANEFKFSEVIGKSKRIMDTLAIAQKVAASKVNILITGESGTGKEVFARAIHEASGRTGKMIAVNCSAIPEHLFESELFGYEEGAFTGAAKGGKIGKFELANNGTLFLDEIGDMPLNMQSKLLRVLQDGVINRIGSEKNVNTDFRIIAATNKDLKEAIENKEFRSDLFYRLAVVQIELPSLRDRKEDIIELSRYFIRDAAKREGIIINKVDEEIYNIFENYPWEGNIRELKNVIHRIIILSENGQLSKNDIPHYILENYNERMLVIAQGEGIQREENYLKKNASKELQTSKEKCLNPHNSEEFHLSKEDYLNPYIQEELHASTDINNDNNELNNYDLEEAIKELEIKMITKAMKECKGNKADAAKLLNINRSTLYYKLNQYKL